MLITYHGWRSGTFAGSDKARDGAGTKVSVLLNSASPFCYFPEVVLQFTK